MSKLLISYGTLRKGQSRNSALGDSKYYGEIVVKGFKMYSLGGFPAVVQTGDDNDTIKGELYDVSDEVSQLVDRIEGFNRNIPIEDNKFYIPLVIPLGGYEKKEAEIYVMREDSPYLLGNKIESGDWVEFVNNRKSNKVVT